MVQKQKQTNQRTKNIVNGKWMNWGKSSFLRKNLWSNCRVSSIPKGSWNKEEGGEEEIEEEEKRLHIAASDTSFGRILYIYWEGSSQIPVSKSFRKETRRLKSGYRSDRSICILYTSIFLFVNYGGKFIRKKKLRDV